VRLITNKIWQAGSNRVPNISEISDSGCKCVVGRKEGRTNGHDTRKQVILFHLSHCRYFGICGTRVQGL